jgi:hypothetical protein
MSLSITFTLFMMANSMTHFHVPTL